MHLRYNKNMRKNSFNLNQLITTVTFFAVLAIAGLAYINLIMPFGASFGGQWNAGSSHATIGSRDSNFYPQPAIHPVDLFIYGVGLAVVVYLWSKAVRHKSWKAFSQAAISTVLLPALWIGLVLATGFNYHACNLASQYNVCQNPVPLLMIRLSIAIGILVAWIPLTRYLWRRL